MSNINLCECEEHWMEIKNNKGSKYLLSSKGRLYSYYSNDFICKINKKNNYVYLGGSSKFFSKLIHRLVFRYFNQINIEEVSENNHIDHINTIRNHNCLCNLRCCSRTENQNNLLTKNKKIGKNSKLYKKERSKEIKKKISESHKGKKKTQEHKKKISESNKKQKIYICYFCNSVKMSKGNFNNHHGNGKCLFN